MGKKVKEEVPFFYEELSSIADENEILEYLTSVLRGETIGEVIVMENIGSGQTEARIMDKKPDQRERIKAAELLGKRLGAFSKEEEDGSDTQIVFNLAT